MVISIQPKVAPIESPISGAAGSGVPQSTTPASDQAQKAVVTPPSRAQVKIDTEMMRSNLKEAITRINDIVRDGGRGLNFSLDEKLGRPIVLVRNLESGEVIRQIPNEVVVRVAHSIEDLKGMLHNEVI